MQQVENQPNHTLGDVESSMYLGSIIDEQRGSDADLKVSTYIKEKQRSSCTTRRTPNHPHLME